MQAVIYALDERLANPGDTCSFKGHINEDGYELGIRSFKLPRGLDFDLILTNAGDGILVTGILSAHVVGSCDRCLDEAAFDIQAEIDEYFLFSQTESSFGESQDDDVDFSFVAVDNTIDLSDAFTAALLMDTPFVVVCREDCKGLCPLCGANLNHEDCGHAQELEKRRLAASPFAILKEMHFGESADNSSL